MLTKGDIYIPSRVKQDIEERLALRVEKTVAEFESAEEDEDVLTGHLGGNLTTHVRQVRVSDGERPGYWTWSLRYRKFRGRGPGATEKKLGADGIVELSVDRRGGSSTKSMLFQAKMANSQGSRELASQCARLSTWREAAAVFSYSATGLEALALDEVLRTRGNLSKAKGSPLAVFLGQNFVGCEVGNKELAYHIKQKMLTWVDTKGRRVAVRFAIKHRIKIDIKPPTGTGGELAGINEISADEIVHHRMQFTDSDLLGTSWDATPEQVKQRKKELTKTYHPDLWVTFPESVREMMELRTKEFQSIDVIKKRK